MGWTYNTPDGVANDGPHLSAVAISFTGVSLIILLLRFYVRGVMIKTIGSGMREDMSVSLFQADNPDDWTLLVTWVSRALMLAY